MSVKELTKKDFNSFVGKGNAIVDFWAEWCGPCKIMEPHFKKAAETIKGVKFGKVDVDAENELAQEHDVMSIPTTIFFKDGEIVDKTVGAISLDAIKKKIDENF